MNALALLDRLDAAGIELTAADGRLHVKAPAGAVGAELREALKIHKDELLSYLGGDAERLPVVDLLGDVVVEGGPVVLKRPAPAEVVPDAVTEVDGMVRVPLTCLHDYLVEHDLVIAGWRRGGRPGEVQFVKRSSQQSYIAEDYQTERE